MGVRVYDPDTGVWTYVANNKTELKQNSTIDSKTDLPKTATVPKVETVKVDQKASSDKLVATSSDPKGAVGSTEKKYNEINYNILNGSVALLAKTKNLKINCGDTVTIKNVGSYLSGKMYVQDREITLGSDGLSLTMTVINTDFTDALKKGKSTGNSGSSKSSTKVSSLGSSDKNDGKKVHTVVKGDSLWSIAVKYYGKGSKYTDIAKANSIKESDYKKIKIGTKLIIP